MRRIARYALYGFLGLVGFAVVAAFAAVLVLRSSWFSEQVRSRILYEVEKATGGRTELSSFDFDWSTFTARVRGLVLHGTESAGEPPLLRADSVTVGLRILSLWQKRFDLESVVVERPRVNVIVYEDGRTNLPKPRVPRQSGKSTLDTILDLAIKRFRIADGAVQAQMRSVPLNMLGENLRVQIHYEPAPARYRGEIRFRSLDVQAGHLKTLPIEIETRAVLERDRLQVESLRLAAKGLAVDASGAVEHFAAPQATVRYSAKVDLRQLDVGLKLGPVLNRGVVTLAGSGSLTGPSGAQVSGKLRGQGLAFRERGIFIENIGVTSGVRITPGRIELPELAVSALGGRFDGRGEIAELRDFRVSGDVRGFALRQMTHLEEIHQMEWSGAVSGPVQLTGSVIRGLLTGARLKTQLAIAPAEGDNSVEGRVDLDYDQRAGTISFGPSNLVTRFSRIDFNGILGRLVNVSVESANLEDAQPAIAMFSSGPPPVLPIKLMNHGAAKFHGVVSGPLKAPTIQGRASATNFVVDGRTFDRAEADVTVSRSGVTGQNITAARLGVRASGSAQVGFSDWRPLPTEPLAAKFAVRSPSLADVLQAAEAVSPVDATTGELTANVTLGGTIGAPQIGGRAQVVKVVLYGQPIERLKGDAHYTDELLEVRSAQLASGNSRAQASASFDHPKGNWSEGRVKFQVASRGIDLAQVKAVHENAPGMEGRLETEMRGELTLARTGFRPGALNGWVALRDLAAQGEQLGALQLTAATKAAQVDLRLDGDLVGSKMTGTADCSLHGEYPARGHIDFTSLRFSTLLARLRRTGPAAPPPFTGLVSGMLDFSGNATDPKSWKGTLQLPTFEIQPGPGYAADVPKAQELILRNTGPVQVDVDLQGARVRQARFRSKDTNVSVTGRCTFGSKNPWDLRIQGGVDLELLRDLQERLYSAGSMVVDVSIRGALERPDIYGRVDLHNASLNLAEFPNGIDNANGVIFLYRDRAMIETLTAQSGGGTVAVSGFVSFGDVTTFHLSAKAADVRLRYPEGVSSTSNADLTFTGTTDRSVLGGSVTITRVGFNPRSDLGTILANTAQPVEVPAQPSRFRQGLRFDVHVTTAPQVQLQTKLTKDIEADANLRLRGDATRPVVLGRVMVSQGDVMFFGNKYTIDTGQILFVNAAKIEPTVNLDLETRVRGIDVTLHVSGPVNKLNVSYRSDPPLSFSDIVALLTTGREPGLTQGVSGSQSQIGQNWQQAGAGALVSSAIASPIAGRLERFFGVSRLKIDPQVTGLTINNAAARVTLEQNITPKLTFTYITDLSRAQAQTVRIEWDFTSNWSGVAVREENGLFGIDFLYRKQIK